jgi:hypothetical protein
MSNDLEVRIKSWLNKQGFPLEMEVAAMAREAGFNVSQSECYLDPETNVPREIDLILSKGAFTDGDGVGHLSYSLYVECKSSKDKPWLLFATPKPDFSEAEEEQFFEAMNSQSSVFTSNYGVGLILNALFDKS